MKQRWCTTIRAGLVIGLCLFAAGALMAQPPSDGQEEQILPPLDPPMEVETPPAPPAGNQPPPSGYGAGTVGAATFQIDPDTGALIVLADDQTNEQIQMILQKLDRPVPQVLIKVLFLEVAHTDNLDLGVEGRYLAGSSPDAAQYTPYLTTTGPSGVNPPGMLAQNPTLIGPATPATNLMGNPMAPGEIDWRDTLQSAFGVAAAQSADGGGMYHIITKDLDMTLRALAKVGKLNVLSRPSVLARNNEQAYIQIGESVPYITTTRYVTGQAEPVNTVDYRDTGIILQVTPHITPEGLVQMVIDGDTGISATDWTRPIPITAGVFQYPITQRLVNTTVIVPNGMTVVIGGLMTDQITDSISKIPILGDVPWAGTFFRRTVKTKQKTELIIFLTPHVVEKTPRLETLSVAEMSKTELAPTAFTADEMNRHLDNWQTLAPRPKPPAPRAGFWKRTLAEVRSAVSIFR